MIPSRPMIAGAAVLALTLSACGEAESADWAGEVTDSAGVTMIANPAHGLWGEGDAWSLVEAYRVGGMDAAIESQFGLIIGLDLDAEGNTYVLDQQASEVRVFGPSGEWLRTLSGPGGGPGELGPAVMALFVVDDAVWVPDPTNARVTRFTLAGEPLDALPLDLTRGVPLRWDELADDRVVAQLRSMSAFTGEGGTASDAIVSVGGEDIDTLALLPQGGTISQVGIRFFSSEPLWDAGPDGTLLSAMNAEYRIGVRDASGALRRVVSKSIAPREVTSSDQQRILDAIREMMSAQAGVPPEAIDQILQNASFAEHYPAMSQVVSGPDGSLWVQRVQTATEIAESGQIDIQDMGSSEWEVFDGEGRFLGSLTFPGRFQPLRVIGDAFWGVDRDDLDVPSVVSYRVERPS